MREDKSRIVEANERRVFLAADATEEG